MAGPSFTSHGPCPHKGAILLLLFQSTEALVFFVSPQSAFRCCKRDTGISKTEIFFMFENRELLVADTVT